jgi:hypothetical protein
MGPLRRLTQARITGSPLLRGKWKYFPTALLQFRVGRETEVRVGKFYAREFWKWSETVKVI